MEERQRERGERKRHRKILYLLVHSSNASESHGWVSPKPGVHGRDPITWTTAC